MRLKMAELSDLKVQPKHFFMNKRQTDHSIELKLCLLIYLTYLKFRLLTIW